MLLDRTHRTWAFLSAVILAVATAAYVIYAENVAAYSAHRRQSDGAAVRHRGLGVHDLRRAAGRTETGAVLATRQCSVWLEDTLWLGTLSVPLILFHSGFGLGGVVRAQLLAFFAIVVLSGFFGLAMQDLLPRLLTSQVPRETLGHRSPSAKEKPAAVRPSCFKGLRSLPVQSDTLLPQLKRLSEFAVDIQTREKSAKGKAEKDEVRNQGWLDLPGRRRQCQPVSRRCPVCQNQRLVSDENDFSDAAA